MLRTGGLQKRELPPTRVQTQMRDHILSLWKQWDDDGGEADRAPMNLLPRPPAERSARPRCSALKEEVGECTVGRPGDRRRTGCAASSPCTCAKGTVGVFFTLAPTQPPGAAPRVPEAGHRNRASRRAYRGLQGCHARNRFT